MRTFAFGILFGTLMAGSSFAGECTKIKQIRYSPLLENGGITIEYETPIDEVSGGAIIGSARGTGSFNERTGPASGRLSVDSMALLPLATAAYANDMEFCVGFDKKVNHRYYYLKK